MKQNQQTQVTATVESTGSGPNYTVTIPESVSLGTLSSDENNIQTYEVAVKSNASNGFLTVTGETAGELQYGQHSIPYTGTFGTQVVDLANIKTRNEEVLLLGEIQVQAEDVAKAVAGNYTGTKVFTMQWSKTNTSDSEEIVGGGNAGGNLSTGSTLTGGSTLGMNTLPSNKLTGTSTLGTGQLSSSSLGLASSGSLSGVQTGDASNGISIWASLLLASLVTLLYVGKKKLKLHLRTGKLAGGLALFLALFAVPGMNLTAEAASGTVYTCQVSPEYRHPVTGVIEDAGGESGYATGQGVVGSCVASTGILEVTDQGSYYLTVRLGMMDYTSNHSFWVQTVGESSWSSPAVGVTGSGTDSNGSTLDVCIQVPSENSIVRCSMYVDVMGREVVYYFYPSNYTAGNQTNMTATMVTESSGSQSANESEATGNTNAGSTTAGNTASTSSTGAASSTSLGGTSSTLSQSASLTSEEAEETDDTVQTSEVLTKSEAGETTLLSDEVGLILSTDSEEDETAMQQTSGEGSYLQRTLLTMFAVIVSGLSLLAGAGFLLYYCRKNWNRWGGALDDV
jgi:LPXTG-motif cell wall-anchored protein